MRTSLWKTGLGALVAVAGLGHINPAHAQRDANLDVYFDRGESNLECKNGFAVSCFNVTADKNITHIFVNIDFDACYDEAPFFVTVDGQEVTRFHTRGGPCRHDNGNGQIDIERIVWFPLPGNQKEAEVCVYTEGVVAPVSVGAKAANECEEAENRVYECKVCEKKPCHDYKY